MKVFLVTQHIGAGVVQVEEGLQVAGRVGAPQRVDRGVLQVDAMPAREGEDHLRLEGALDVEVELRLRDAADEAFGHFGSWPSTPSTYQFTLSISLSVSVLPASSLIEPFCSLTGPVKGWNLPALMAAAFSATSFFAASGTEALMLTRSLKPSFMPPHIAFFTGLPASAPSATPT